MRAPPRLSVRVSLVVPAGPWRMGQHPSPPVLKAGRRKLRWRKGRCVGVAGGCHDASLRGGRGLGFRRHGVSFVDLLVQVVEGQALGDGEGPGADADKDEGAVEAEYGGGLFADSGHAGAVEGEVQASSGGGDDGGVGGGDRVGDDCVLVEGEVVRMGMSMSSWARVYWAQPPS